jgi:hypothetical protein
MKDNKEHTRSARSIKETMGYTQQILNAGLSYGCTDNTEEVVPILILGTCLITV